LLSKAIHSLPNLEQVYIGCAMTPPEAERIFSILRTSSSLEHLFVWLGSVTDGIAEPLERYLRESRLLAVSLSWSRYEDDNSEPVTIAEATVTSICNGIGASTSINSVLVSHAPPEDVSISSAATALARATADSRSLLRIGFEGLVPSSHTFANHFGNALMHTEPVKNFDLCYRQIEEWEQYIEFELNRSAPWKPLLSQDVPLNYWPSILAKTNTWNEETSHRPLDALFFLLKEKNDVLLQNVRRRPIRKRKRSSLYTYSS